MTKRTCSIDDCNEPTFGHGWCATHYQRWRRHGDPERGGTIQRQTGTGQPCAVEGCPFPVVAVELCNRHYRRFKRCGDPLGGRPSPGAMTVEERFWSKVDKTPTCWLWTDAPNGAGYGMFGANGVTWMAHRYSMILAGHMLTDGLTIDHLCRVRLCVNPAHLEEVTYGENLRRAAGARSGMAAPAEQVPAA